MSLLLVCALTALLSPNSALDAVELSTMIPHTSKNTTVSTSGPTIRGNTTTAIPSTSKTVTIVSTTSGTSPHKTTTLHPTISKITTGPATTKPGNMTSATPHIGNTTTIAVTTIAVPTIPHFDAGSFIGGIVLAFALVGIFYFGRKFCIPRSGTHYRTIEETEAII